MLFKFCFDNVKLVIHFLLSYAFNASIFQLTGAYIANIKISIKKAIEPVITNKVELNDSISLVQREPNAFNRQALRQFLQQRIRQGSSCDSVS